MLPVISEFFTNGCVLVTPFKKMMESSTILEDRETNFRNSTYLYLFKSASINFHSRMQEQIPRATHLGEVVTVMSVLTTGKVRALHS